MEYYNDGDGSMFAVVNFQNNGYFEVLQSVNTYKIIWCTTIPQELFIDGSKVDLKVDQLLFCTPENILKIPDATVELRGYLFNEVFYKKLYQDISCNGILFYGLDSTPIIQLGPGNKSVLQAIHLLIHHEFEQNDLICGQMLCATLKRLLLTSTGLLKHIQDQNKLSDKQVDLLRSFNLFVENHYKEKHQVSDYADLLSRSPKTLSNLFKKHGIKSPLKIINSRILLEAKRLLQFSDLNVEDVAQELGYAEPSHFSKFFKKQVGTSPLAYKKSLK